MHLELVLGVLAVVGTLVGVYVDIRVRLAKVEQKMTDLMELQASWKDFLKILREQE